MKFPFPTTPELLAVSQGYINQHLIADLVLPRVRVGKQEFKYNVATKSQRLTLPNTTVGRKSRPNQLDFSLSEKTASTQDYALDSGVPQDDIDNACEGFNPLNNAVQGLTDLIALDREVRVAKMFANSNNFISNQTLTGAEQFTDANSDPIKIINAHIDACLHRPNVMVLGSAAWTLLRAHPKIVSATQQNSGAAGNATKEAVARLFELDEVVVGQAHINTAKRGKAANLDRVWGMNIALIHRNPNAQLTQGSTFGVTAQYNNRLAGAKTDDNIGMRGGQVVRVGESVAEVILDTGAGALIKDIG